MLIRPLRSSDIEPLHTLYKSLALLMPHHLNVSVEQFAQELTTTRYQEDEFWDRNADLPLVAVRTGQPVSFLHACFLQSDARHRSLKAGTGIIRFLFSAPENADALRSLVQTAIQAAQTQDCPVLQALSAYAPLFHNCGASGLTNAWPWIGRVLSREGFETMGLPALSMYCSLERAPILRLPLPPGAELRYEWITRIGRRDETEGGYHIFFGADRAAESMWHFGEKYVEGAGKDHLHLFWLGTNELYRGRDLGRILLRETLAQAQESGTRSSDLRCRVNNFYAHALYRAEGYEPKDLLWSFQKQLATLIGIAQHEQQS